MKRFLPEQNLKHTLLLGVIFMFLGITFSPAQVADPYDMRLCRTDWNCTANDAHLDNVYLVADEFGTPLPDTCSTGAGIVANIRANFTVTATNRYDIAFYADLYVDGIKNWNNKEIRRR